MNLKCKKCRWCKNEFIPFSSTAKTCTYQCALKLVEAEKEKKSKLHKSKEIKRVRKQLKELDRKDLKWQHKQTKTSFNKMRVLQEKLWFKERGLEPCCISCAKTNMDWCCGHFKTVGSSGGLRYDPINTYLQCNRNCNMGLSGNINGNNKSRGYLKGLADRFGEDKAKEIIDYCESNQQPKKWTWQEIEEIRIEANKEIRMLEKLI